MNDLVSVIIPCYQQGNFLIDAITSLQSQTHTNWEAIIVNDGSTDDTELVANKICKSDFRVQYIVKQNGGLSSARNAGLAVAKGDWIQFLDADDLLLPDKFTKQIEVVGNDCRCLTYTDFYYGACENPTSRVVPWTPSREFVMSRPLLDMSVRWEYESFSIPIHTALFPSWLFLDVHFRFDELLPSHEDWDMWMHVLKHVESVYFVRDELAIYRVRLNSMCRDEMRMWRGFSLAIKKQQHIFRDDPEVTCGLNYLETMNDYYYRRGLKGSLRRLLDDGAFSKWPWPSEIIRRFVRAPERPDF